MHSDKNDENYIYYVIGQNLKKMAKTKRLYPRKIGRGK